MPSIATTRLYEAIYIVDPDLGDEQIQAIVAKYRGVVENGGGAVTSIEFLERRKLAYEIKGRTEGIYVVMQFTSEPKVEHELNRVFQISEDQIRSMIIKPEPVTAPANGAEPATSAAPSARPTAAAQPAQNAPAEPTAPAASAEAETAPAETAPAESAPAETAPAEAAAPEIVTETPEPAQA